MPALFLWDLFHTWQAGPRRVRFSAPAYECLFLPLLQLRCMYNLRSAFHDLQQDLDPLAKGGHGYFPYTEMHCENITKQAHTGWLLGGAASAAWPGDFSGGN